MIIKITSVLGITGTVGGGVILSKPYLFPSKDKATLKSLVEKDNWKLLTSSNGSEITSILGVYKSKNPTPFFNLKGNESDAADKLLEECRELSETIADNPNNKDDFLKKLKKWCVVPKTIRERLKEELNIFPLSTEKTSEDANEDPSWISKIENYGNSNDKFDNLISLEGENENKKAEVLRTRCKTELNVKSFEESFEVTMDRVKLWCVA